MLLFKTNTENEQGKRFKGGRLRVNIPDRVVSLTATPGSVKNVTMSRVLSSGRAFWYRGIIRVNKTIPAFRGLAEECGGETAVNTAT